MRPFLVATFVILVSLGAAAPGYAQKSEIVLGGALSLTGRFSTEATEHLRAYQLFIDELNAAGGVALRGAARKLPVRLLHYDDQSDTSAAAKLYERLITSDKVDLLFSPWGSGPNFSVTAVTEKHKFPMVLASAASDAIYSRGFKYIYNTTDLASAMPRPLIDFLKTKKGDLKRVAVLYENFLFTTTLRDVFVKAIQAEGFEVVLDERYPLQAQDFTGLMTKVKAAAPDAVIVFSLMPPSVYATRQAREVGVAPKLLFINIGPMYVKEYMEPLGRMTEGVVETGFWHQDLPYPGARQFHDRYLTRFGKPASTDAAYAYMAAQILFQAVEKSGSLDREALNETLKKEEFTTIGGKYRYDARGVNIHSRPFLTQVQDGKRVVAWPPDLTTTTLRYPMAPR